MTGVFRRLPAVWRMTMTKNSWPLKALLALGGLCAVGLCACLYCLLPPASTPAQEQAVVSYPALQALIEDGTLVDTQPDAVWESGTVATKGHGFTPLSMLGPETDSIGVLSIDKIGLSVRVYDSEDAMEDMKKGASHYRASSYWNGNVALAAHIGNASYSFFERLDELETGDVLQYETSLGVRQYRVDEIHTIADDDWSVIGRTDENCLTLTTCVEGAENLRLCVRAVEMA